MKFSTYKGLISAGKVGIIAKSVKLPFFENYKVIIEFICQQERMQQ